MRDALLAALRASWARWVGGRADWIPGGGRAVVGGWDRIGGAVVDFPAWWFTSYYAMHLRDLV